MQRTHLAGRSSAGAAPGWCIAIAPRGVAYLPRAWQTGTCPISVPLLGLSGFSVYRRPPYYTSVIGIPVNQYSGFCSNTA